MPTAARTMEYDRASCTACRLVRSVVPTATTAVTRAVRARSSTASRSGANCSSSRWACVSMSCMELDLLDRFSGRSGFGRLRGREQPLQCLDLATLAFDHLLQERSDWRFISQGRKLRLELRKPTLGPRGHAPGREIQGGEVR